jgi:hypothetical protein
MEDYSQILIRYKRMRLASREMNNILMESCRPSVEQAAKDLGVWLKGSIVLDMDQMPVLMDRAIHRHPKGGPSVVDRYAAEYPPAPGTDAQAVLAGMRQAFFSLFQVSRVVKGLGVCVTDILRDGEHLLADVNLGESAVEHMVLASRVLPFDGFIMTTGAPLPVSVEVLKWVVANLERDDLTTEDLRAMSSEGWSQIEISVMRACLHHTDDEHIKYQDVPGGGTPTLTRDTDHVGRNDPCPCGSGKKSKKCCGR